MDKRKNKIIDESPVFMIGMPRSGTSVLSEAISLHKELGWFSNYLNRFPKYPLLSIMDRITNLPYFGTSLRGKKKQDYSINSLVRRLLPYSSEANNVWSKYCGEKFLWEYLIDVTASNEEKQKMQNYVSFVLRCQGKNKFFTKFTGPPRIIYLRSIFPDSYFIHVTRDPRSVVSSLLNVTFWRDGGGLIEPWWKNGLSEEYLELWKCNDKSAVALAALQWRRVLEQTWTEKEVLEKGKYIEIRYEDFLKSPHEHLKLIFEKVGLNDSVEAHKYLTSIGKLKDMNYKYKQRLSMDEIDTIDRIVSVVAKRLDYGND